MRYTSTIRHSGHVRGKNSQRGFGIITAIFLLVVLGMLAAMMVTFFSGQQQGFALDANGSRAYQAARAGVEWAAYNISITAQGAQWPGCATVPSPLIAANSLSGTLSPYVVVLTCSATQGVEYGNVYYVYSITSTASAGGVPGNTDYVERSVNVTLIR